jgi:peptidoglycan/LPS O-acetylase OafA/YrhL
VVLACVGLGLAFTTLPAADFLADAKTIKFLWKNAIAIRGGEYYLPAVFQGNPFPLAINGSLWTLLWELRMYMTLAVLWWLAGFATVRRQSFYEASIVVLAVVTTALYLTHQFAPGLLPRPLVVKTGLVPMFLLGAACYVLRARIALRIGWFGAAAALVVAAGLSADHTSFRAVYFLAMPYLVLFLAYMPTGALRGFNRLGDYSYGVYIIAFPVQQTVVALMPGISALQLIVWASLVTLALAWCSWHFVEEPALECKVDGARRLRELLGRARAMGAGMFGTASADTPASR